MRESVDKLKEKFLLRSYKCKNRIVCNDSIKTFYGCKLDNKIQCCFNLCEIKDTLLYDINKKDSRR